MGYEKNPENEFGGADISPTDFRDTKQETKFELKVKPEDFKSILDWMKQEKSGNRLAFMMAMLGDLDKNMSKEEKEAVKETIGELKFPQEYHKKALKRTWENAYVDSALKKPTSSVFTEDAKEPKDTKETAEKEFERFETWTTEEIDRENSWGKLYNKAYMEIYKDYLVSERGQLISLDDDFGKTIEKIDFTLSDWSNLKKDFRREISANNWTEVIKRAGLLCKLVGAEKFEEMFEFSDENKEAIIKKTNALKEKDPGTFGTNIRYISELPETLQKELLSEIKVTKGDWDRMEEHLGKLKTKKNTEEEKKIKGEIGDYWTYSLELCNLKIIENLIRDKKIIVSEEKA